MRTLKAKWAGRCAECGQAFSAGEEIAWTGQAWHPGCHAGMLAKQAAEDAHESAFQAKYLAEAKAGLHVRLEVSEKAIMVRGAVSAKMAKEAAQAFVCSVSAASGLRAWLVGHTRGGKRYVGKEVVWYPECSNLGHHEGWSFPWRQA